MTRTEAKQKLIDQYKIDYNKSRMPICKPWKIEESSKSTELYIPIELVLDVILEVANT